MVAQGCTPEKQILRGAPKRAQACSQLRGIDAAS
jgi:hypothetical protein